MSGWQIPLPKDTERSIRISAIRNIEAAIDSADEKKAKTMLRHLVMYLIGKRQGHEALEEIERVIGERIVTGGVV